MANFDVVLDRSALQSAWVKEANRISAHHITTGNGMMWFMNEDEEILFGFPIDRVMQVRRVEE